MPDPTLTLRTTLTSPFGRKVRMAAASLGLSDRIRIVPADTRDAADTLRTQNPLGKIPCLLTEDAGVIYDSGVIIEYLQELAGTDRMVPLSGPLRYQVLTRARLADGIAEAGLLIVYEARFREPEQISQRWLDHQSGKAMRGLAQFAASPPDPDRLDLVSIGLSCALGYLDWRDLLGWRSAFPALADWIAVFAERQPIFRNTDRPETV